MIAAVITLQFRYAEELSDLGWLHAANMCVQWIWFICFFGCLFCSPGYAIDSMNNEKGSSTYDEALSVIASDFTGVESGKMKLCHSCHVRRPLRAKHDQFLRKCVHKFDHHCPFVGNTIGRDNHRFFLGLTVIHQFCFFLFLTTSIYFARRVYCSWSLIAWLLYSFMWDLMMMGLGSYHLQLCLTNMTTNESVGIAKYDYLLDPTTGQFDNPFCRGSTMGNLMDVLMPYKDFFFYRDDVIKFINRKGPGLRIGKGPSEHSSRGYSGHSHGHSHGHGHNDYSAPLMRHQN